MILHRQRPGGKHARARPDRLSPAFDAACAALAGRAAARRRSEDAYEAGDNAAYSQAHTDMDAAAARVRFSVLLYERLAWRAGVPLG